MRILNGQTAIAGLVLAQSLIVTIHKKFGLLSVGFFNKSIFLLIKEQDNSNESSLMIGPNGSLSSSKIMYLVSLLDILWSFWLFKIFLFKINNGFLNYDNFFLLIWSTLSLMFASSSSSSY